MDIKEIRRINLMRLIAGAGSVKALAEAIGTDPNYLSQIKSVKTKASMGDALARQIERSLKQPRGWMDHLHDERKELEGMYVDLFNKLPDELQKEAILHMRWLLRTANIEAPELPPLLIDAKPQPDGKEQD